MTETVYIKIEKSIKVREEKVTLSQLGEVWCRDAVILAKCKSMTIFHLHEHRQACSVVEVISVLESRYPEITVDNQGETDFVIERLQEKPPSSSLWEWLRLAVIGGIVFFGSAFAMMTFNEDVGVGEVFENIQQRLTGAGREGISFLEYGYILGVPSGILLFYNHISTRRKKADPTPLEVEMRTYEKNLYTTMVENEAREKKNHSSQEESKKT